MTALRPAVFLDRDGTVNVEVNYLGDADQFRLLPHVAPAIRQLNETGVPVVIVTNQSGIARGYFSRAEMDAVHACMHTELAQAGARIDAVYFCPHHPDDGCTCRKPAPGLLIRAAAEMAIDLSKSVIIGDKYSDLAAGKAVGCLTVLVLTGHGAQEYRQGGVPTPDYVAGDLTDAVAWWLEKRR